MNFLIRHVNENGFDLINLIDETSGTTVSLLPGRGATLHAFLVKERSGLFFNVIDNYRNAEELNSQMTTTFKGPKLSPFPCRIPNGIYQFEGKEYRLQNLFKDGTAIHGLLYNKSFAITGENADGAAMVAMEYIY